jgi:uncharacterized membrane protein
MKSFIEARGSSLLAVVFIMGLIALAQTNVSYTLTVGALGSFVEVNRAMGATIMLAVRIVLFVALVVLWLLNRKSELSRLIVIGNIIYTLNLITQTAALMSILSGSLSEAIRALLIDVVMMGAANILIFSVWYWIIDPPGVDERPRADDPWEFLFPQRGGGLPHYENWVPHYWDYFFVAFTTSFAFSPTDTAPLTRRAKMLMLLQAAISVITLTGVAGTAVNIVAGGK